MKLNNKGYLIVEVILAGVLTFTMAYFLINLTLKIRNRFDDTNVETVLLNDKTVVTNEVMDDIIKNKVNNVEYITNGIKITFEDGSSKELTVIDNTIYYGTYIKKLNENAVVGNVSIKRNGNYFTVEIPITTKYSKDDYGINIVGFTKTPAVPLTCTLKANDSNINATFSQDINLVYNGWDSAYTSNNGSTNKSISAGTHTYYVKDDFGNTGYCSISVINTTETSYLVDAEVVHGTRYSGSCSCIAITIDHPDGMRVNGICDPIKGCSCSGTNWINNCKSSYQKIGYKCNGVIQSNPKCKKTGMDCQSGYTKISDTYCYK